MQLTKNFTLKEFKCRDGSVTPCWVIENLKLVAEQLQILRDYSGLRIKINSGYRSPKYNKKIKGVKNSMHKKGFASDIRMQNKTPKQVNGMIEFLISTGQMKQGGLGQYKSFNHYDIGYNNKKRRWKKL